MTAPPDREVTLIELLDRALNKGVFLWGDITLSVADVDLIFLGLKVLLSSVDTMERLRGAARGGQWAGASQQLSGSRMIPR